MENLSYNCLLCGARIPIPFSNGLQICAVCEARMPMPLLQDLGLMGFCLTNFLWYKDLGEYFYEENLFGQIFAIVKKGRIVKTDLTTSLLYSEKVR